MNDQELLAHCNEYLNYDPETGIVTWKRKKRKATKVIIGAEVGCLSVYGYRVMKMDDIQYKVHRIIYLMTYGEFPESIDHINGIKDDNRIDNLRPCNASQNSVNTGLSVRNNSGFKGVCLNNTKNKWKAGITKDFKKIHLGYFDCKIEAAKAYDVAAKELHGKFAYLNFPLL